jgi:hypothetical protein
MISQKDSWTSGNVEFDRPAFQLYEGSLSSLNVSAVYSINFYTRLQRPLL